jgi:hypothetical protein
MTPQPTTHLHPDRDLRQREIIPPAKLDACHALVIGVGAIGRQVAVQLAAVGVPAIDLVDPDRVGVENLAPQAYWPADLGRPKVAATAELCRCINPEVNLSTRAERFRRSSVRTLPCLADGGDVDSGRTAVFCCVDSITTRGLIWEAVRERAGFWADGRMAAEVVRILASGDPAIDASYASTLFPESQAYAGACTAKSTVYAASIAAGLMLSQFTRWLRGLPVDSDVMLNLLSMELSAS